MPTHSSIDPQNQLLKTKQSRADRQALRKQLERQKEQIYTEIQAYPFPIPACDQQYNYLLEERARIRRELRRLEQQSPVQEKSEETISAL